MADDAYYRQVVAQMQREYTRAVAALEKQVATLTRHNALLTRELHQTKEQQREWAQEATQTVTQLQAQLTTQANEAIVAHHAAAEREEALTLELTALKSLLQQEQEHWTRAHEAEKQAKDRLAKQVVDAKAETMQELEQNKTLRREMKALQRRVETAVATSRSFEQRLLTVVQEKQEHLHAMELEVAHYKKKAHEKRAQNKYLTDALMRVQDQRQSGESSSGTSPTERPRAKGPCLDTSPMLDVPLPRRRKRELTLPEEMKAVTSGTAARLYKSKKLGVSRSGTSPTSSSPEISPRSARMTPYQRAPSVATTAPTTVDGVSFNSNSSSGSLRSLRTLRNVTTRGRGSRHSSDSDSRNESRRGTAAREGGTSPTERLQRELSGLRRKLDSCIADAAARW